MNRFAVKITSCRAFTLLEMMVVVLIITILLSVTGPAFQRLTRGNAVDASSRMIAAQLRLARAEAVSRRKYVAVILPGKDFINPDNAAIYRYQSFRAAIVDRSGDAFEFVEWIEGTKWTFLPMGAVIPEVDGDRLELSGSDPPEPSGNWTIKDNGSILLDGIDTHGNDVRAVIFAPNGRCVKKIYVTVMEGVNIIPDPITVPDDDEEDVPADDDEYDDEFLFERANKHNIRVLEISPFTGKIKFLF